jgi:membrane carboxypeptidase/penicillin-binding protein
MRRWEPNDPYAAYAAYLPRKKPLYRRVWFILLAALILLPAIAGYCYYLHLRSIYGARAAGFDFSQLSEMESASTIYDRNGAVLSRIFLENRDTAADFPYQLTQAVVAAEDNRFYQHHGIDLYGMFRAAIKNWRAGHIRQGASTVTQQLARNTFSLHERTYDRKMTEIFLALEIEKHFSKAEIMNLYLNRVYFGSGFYGAQAASRGYFGKEVADLDLGECATLAGLLKNPNNLSPWGNRQACIDGRNFVLSRMLDLKMINQETYDHEIASNLAVKNRKPVHTDSYAVDMIRSQVDDIVGKDRAIADGYKIYTTIDPDLQKRSEQSLRDHLEEVERHPGYDHQTSEGYAEVLRQHRADEDEKDPPSPEYLQGAVVVLDNEDGGILAIAGGRDFNQSQYNRAISSARPLGTAFTPFVFAAAFEKGLFPGTLVEDTLMDNRQVMIGGVQGILGEWGPERIDNTYEGPIPARSALVKSKNAATVRLGMQTGLDNVINLAKAAGLARAAGKDDKGNELLNLRRFPATYLGSSEMTLMDVTLAYTIFPDQGTRPSQTYIIQRILDKNDNLIFESHPEKRYVIKDTTAYEVHSCLSDVLDWGTGDKAYTIDGLKKFPLAGKTGTAYNFTDDWFIGYSSAITCGVWAGFDKPSSIYRGAFSSDIVLPIWVDIMNSSFARHPATDIPQPSGLQKYEICTASGQLATDQCYDTVTDKTTGETSRRRTTYYELATEDQAPKVKCTVHNGGVGAVTSSAPIGQSPLDVAVTPSKYPRATIAMDLSKVTPIPMLGPTVISDDDPYQSMKPNIVMAATRVSDNAKPPGATTDNTSTPLNAGGPAEPASNPGTASAGPATTDGTVRIMRAQPAGALDSTQGASPIHLDPPDPIKF